MAGLWRVATLAVLSPARFISCLAASVTDICGLKEGPIIIITRPYKASPLRFFADSEKRRSVAPPNLRNPTSIAEVKLSDLSMLDVFSKEHFVKPNITH